MDRNNGIISLGTLNKIELFERLFQEVDSKICFDVSELGSERSFLVSGFSYIGKPKENTVLFVTKKMAGKIDQLSEVQDCLVFCENSIDISENILKVNYIISSQNPQYEYAQFAIAYDKKLKEIEKRKKYIFTKNLFYCGENVVIGKGCIIEPNVIIGHNVIIGDNAYIRAGAVIKNAVIGNYFNCYENTVIGSDSFFMASDEAGNNVRIPSFGKVWINNHVDIGSGTIIERGFNDTTFIDDYVKIDAAVSIAHDVKICKNVTITCGACVAGLTEIGESAYVGMNSTLKQRLKVGNDALIGMGAAIITNVKPESKLFGNPARKYQL